MFIVGIEPKAPGLHIFGKLYIPRLGLPQLLTIAERMGHQCEIYCEEIAPIPWNRVSIADMVLVSSITSTVPRAYAINKKSKEVNSKAPILNGGSHVTFLPEEALDNGADYVFRHEGDESFPQFLRWWESSRDSQKLFAISGLSFKIGDQYYHTPPLPWVDLNTLPTPNLDLICGYKKPEVIPVITSRGCPWGCEFCSEAPMFGKGYRFCSEQKVIGDFQYYDQRYGETPIFIADDNLGANIPRLERLCGVIIEQGLVRSYSGQVRLDLAEHPQTLEIMNRAGFERDYIGYETTNPRSLAAMGKGIRPEMMRKYTKIFHQHGMAIHSMWVLGFDDDTLETIRENIGACIKWHIETTQFLILVPIPGSPLYERLKKEGRIFNWDWSKYDGHHVTFHPKNMTARQLQIAVMLEAMPKLYNYWQTAKIFVLNSLGIAAGIFKRRKWHPFRDTKRSHLTLLARLWGKRVIRKNKKSARKYLAQIAQLLSKAKAQL